MWFIHIRLPFHCSLPHTVDNDMSMDISGLIVAIGDEENDISMIRNAGVGVAMKNAVQSVKDAADYVTEHDNNEDGVAEVIEKFSPDNEITSHVTL